MHTLRTLEGNTIEEMLNPPFRSVNFDDEAAIVQVSTHLRLAWTALPGDDTSIDAVGWFTRDSSYRTDEERKLVPQNPNKDDYRTAWRESVYHMWNHVFYDVMRFLPEVGMGVGHIHPPSHDAFAMDYPQVGDSNGSVAVKKKWDTNVLIVPAFLEPGVSIRMFVSQASENGQSQKTLGSFDGFNTADIWWLKSGVEVCFYVEGDYEKDRKGVAAVLVYGILCMENSGAGKNVNRLDIG